MQIVPLCYQQLHALRNNQNQKRGSQYHLHDQLNMSIIKDTSTEIKIKTKDKKASFPDRISMK